MITGTGTGIGTGLAVGEATVEVEIKASVTILVTGTGISDIGAGVGLEAGALVEVLVIVENVEEANMIMMMTRDVDEVRLIEGISFNTIRHLSFISFYTLIHIFYCALLYMKVLLLFGEVPVLVGAHLQTKHLLLGMEVLPWIITKKDQAHL